MTAETALKPALPFDLDILLGRTKSGYDLHRLAGMLAGISSAEYLSQHMMAAKRFKNRRTLHLGMLARIPGEGLILEFGVASGNSIRAAAEALPDRHMYGFDSFEGLPETWTNDYKAGHFAQVELPEVPKNVTLVKGWFNETLPPFLEDNPGDVAFLHVDCDLYSSTATIFEALEGRIKKGTIIQFDEYFNYAGWQQHEFKAFQEFIERTGLAYRYIGVANHNKQVGVEIL